MSPWTTLTVGLFQHTKKTLEGLHRNIHVFRHPDHIPTNYDAKAELGKSYKSLKLPDLTKASRNAIKSFYGSQDDVVLYWAHHEKLLVIDENVCFLGGLDLCKFKRNRNLWSGI